MAVAYVQGLQGKDSRGGIVATLKHFAAHGASEGGRNRAPAHVLPRELREVHLFPFKAAIKIGRAGAVMNAYHALDGVPCAASKELLSEILRGEWGFDGVVISDFFSIRMLHTDQVVAEDRQKAGILALEAGLDVELPFVECYGENLIDAVKKGLVSEKRVDEAVRRHLRMRLRMGLFEDPFVAESNACDVFEIAEQRELAREVARQSIVLLKNEGQLLPLGRDVKKIALIGPSANSTRNLLGDYSYSAHVESPEDAVEIISILQEMQEAVGDSCEILYAPGWEILGSSTDGIVEAVQLAMEADVAIVVVGWYPRFSRLVQLGCLLPRSR